MNNFEISPILQVNGNLVGHVTCIRYIQIIFVHLDYQQKLNLILFGPLDSGCGLETGFSLTQMHGEIKGKSPGAACNGVRLINGI